MRLIDLHTHHKDREDNLFILNCTLENIEDARNISVGLHPWNIDEDWEQKMQQLSKLATAENVKAIGECGIDKLKSGASVETQIETLKAHIRLSEQLKKQEAKSVDFQDIIDMQAELKNHMLAMSARM